MLFLYLKCSTEFPLDLEKNPKLLTSLCMALCDLTLLHFLTLRHTVFQAH